MFAYFVQNRPFYNVYLAHLESYKVGHPIQFKFFDEIFDKENWCKEPKESFESLMDRRAFQLQEKYEKIIFLYSGGYDSQTIFNVLNRNKIKIIGDISNGTFCKSK